MTPESVVMESMFRVVDKEQQDVDFSLNTAQRTIDEKWHRRMILPKARQEGVSTYFLARSTVKCLGKRNTRAVVISHDSESTERMLLKVKYFLDNIKGPKAVIKNNSKNEITFPKTNSMFYIGTAGARSFGRGDTISDLHCSEVAYWADPKKTMTGLLQAVPKASGCISIESTGNGAGNWYHNQCMRAAKGQSSFKLCFLAWQDFPEYTIPLSYDEGVEFMKTLRDDLDEPATLEKYHLTPGQLAWRRLTIEDECDGDLYEWNKEYPGVLDDCFQVAGGGVFQRVHYVESPDWIKVDAHLHILKGHPDKELHYVVGGDVSGGVGRDASVGEIFCLETEEQVGEYINNRIEPDAFAYKLADLGRLFNEAYLGIESNNHGILTLAELSRHDHRIGRIAYPPHKVYRTAPTVRRANRDQVKRVIDLGVRTTVRSKPLIIGGLRKKLGSTAVIHSPVLKNELSTFVEKEDGTMGAIENCFDDTVIASGMAFFVFSKACVTLMDEPVTAKEYEPQPDPMSLESIVKEMTGARIDQPRQESFFPSYLTKVA